MPARNRKLLDDLMDRYELYLAAETAILGGSQSYSIGSRSVTFADLEQISKMLDKLAMQIRQLDGGNRIRTQRVVPRDI